MARSASKDPIERFRFVVTIFEPQSALNVLHGDGNSYGSVGFTEASLPKANVTEINYRDNLMGHNFIKKPGLVKYDPVTLKKGATSNQYLYNWYNLVYNDAASLNKYSGAIGAFGIVPFQNPYFRKDVIISSVDRAGKFVKHWKLYNAWPLGYKGGNDFNSTAEEKLVEELVLCYESFLELTGATIEDALADEANQIAKATNKELLSGIISVGTTPH